MKGRTRKSNSQFIKECNALFGYNKFEYLSKYTTNKIKIKILCKICNSIFFKTPDKHLNRKQGCPSCSRKEKNIKQTKTHNQFVEQSVNKFGNSFIFLNKYRGDKEKINIECKICKKIQNTKPNYHLNSKYGCYTCSIKGRAKDNTDFIKEAKNTHNDNYIYLSKYINNYTKIKIECKKCNLNFYQLPISHINKGSGCPNCNSPKGTYDKDYFKSIPQNKTKPAKLYFYKFWNDEEEFYKVGISICVRRFTLYGKYKIQLISEVNTTLYDAWLKEQEFINNFKEYKYIPKFKFAGHTECFNKEIYNIMFPKGVNKDGLRS